MKTRVGRTRVVIRSHASPSEVLANPEDLGTTRRVHDPETEDVRSLPGAAHRIYARCRELDDPRTGAADVAFFTDTRLLEAVDDVDTRIAIAARSVHETVRTERIYLVDRLGREGLSITRRARERRARALADRATNPGEEERPVRGGETFAERWSLAHLRRGRTELLAVHARQAGWIGLRRALGNAGSGPSLAVALRSTHLSSQLYLITAALSSCASRIDLPGRARSALGEAKRRIRSRSVERATADEIRSRLRSYRIRIEELVADRWSLEIDALHRAGRLLSAFRTACRRDGAVEETGGASSGRIRRYADRCEREANRLLDPDTDPVEVAFLCILLSMPR